DVEFLQGLAAKGVTHFSADMMSADEYKRAESLQSIIGRFDTDDSASLSAERRMFIGVREIVSTVISETVSGYDAITTYHHPGEADAFTTCAVLLNTIV